MNSRPEGNGVRVPAGTRLDLSRHCIETACRRSYNRAVGAYFASPERGEHLAEKIELLRRALERIDFSALRRDHPLLCGGGPETVLLETDGAAGFRISMGKTVVRAPCKKRE